jgi:hypothetical protein
MRARTNRLAYGVALGPREIAAGLPVLRRLRARLSELACDRNAWTILESKWHRLAHIERLAAKEFNGHSTIS